MNRKTIYIIELLKRAKEIYSGGLIIEIPKNRKVWTDKSVFNYINMSAKGIFFTINADEKESYKIYEDNGWYTILKYRNKKNRKQSKCEIVKTKRGYFPL